MLKLLKKILISILIIIILATLFVIYIDELTHLKHKLFWDQPSELFGIKYKDSRSDVMFKLGKPSLCSDDETVCIWQSKNSNDAQEIVVKFEEDSVKFVVHIDDIFWDVPFRNDVDLMHYILGPEDILAITKDMMTRRYTFTDEGVSYVFKNNKLQELTVGDANWWSNPSEGVSEYRVGGKLVCPSEYCPFDMETGRSKPEYKDKSYRDFL